MSDSQSLFDTSFEEEKTRGLIGFLTYYKWEIDAQPELCITLYSWVWSDFSEAFEGKHLSFDNQGYVAVYLEYINCYFFGLKIKERLQEILTRLYSARSGFNDQKFVVKLCSVDNPNQKQAGLPIAVYE